ncbi:MAG TPA: alpha/beta fold hydrolase [Pyrinomonadaceae bacterium]|nr:alpha/beta fold hydrolase [Pyrinomonadaceae bacterium]
MASSTIIAGMSSTPWLAGVKPNPEASLRLFCFPYAGGGATIFRTWQAELPKEVEVCPVQLPGRGRRLKEAAYTNVHTLVQELAQGLFPFLGKPFAFFGHSMGASISFELARYLRREHHLMPRHLFISGRRAPHMPALHTPIYNLPDAEFMVGLRDLNGTPVEALEQPDLMELLLPLLRADFELSETYTYLNGPLLDCPMSIYGGEGDDDVPREHLEAWGELTTGTVSLKMFPGDHFFLNTAQNSLLRMLSQELGHRLHRSI